MGDTFLYFFPSWEVPLLFYLLYQCRFEVQRFFKSERQPHVLVDALFGWGTILFTLYAWVFLFALAFDFGVVGSVLLYLGCMLLGTIEEIVWPSKDSLKKQIACWVACLPLCWLLFDTVSWFGFFIS